MNPLADLFRVPTTDCTFDTFDPNRGLTTWSQNQLAEARKTAQAYALNPSGCFVLIGPSGTGKSHLALALAQTIQAQGIDVAWVFVPTFLNRLRSSIHTEVEVPIGALEMIQMVETAPCVVLDGFGTGNTTPWTEAQLYQLLGQRSDNNLPTVVTTNRVLETFNPLIRTRLTNLNQGKVCPVVGYESEFIHDLLRSITPVQQAMTFESFNRQPFSDEEQQRFRYNLPQASAVTENFWRDHQGKTLVLMGIHGSGKTHLALALANRRWQLGVPAVYTSLPHLLDRLRSATRGETTESFDTMFLMLRMTPFLIIDNFSTDQATPWVRQMCFQLLDARMESRQTTVLCTSHTLEEIDAPIQSRLADQEFVGVVVLLTPDYRRRRTGLWAQRYNNKQRSK